MRDPKVAADKWKFPYLKITGLKAEEDHVYCSEILT